MNDYMQNTNIFVIDKINNNYIVARFSLLLSSRDIWMNAGMSSYILYNLRKCEITPLR